MVSVSAAMEQEQPTFNLKPQWLMQGAVRAAAAANIFAAAPSGADNQSRGASSRNHPSGHDRGHSSRQSSSQRSSGSNGSRRPDRDGMGKSRGYANFGRNREKNREKDSDSRDWESRSVAADRDGFKSFSTCRPERDRSNHARLKADTRSKVVVSLNNGSTSRCNADFSSSRSNDVVSISESNTVVSTSGSNAAVSTTVSDAAVSMAVSNTTVSTSVSDAAVSTAVSTSVCDAAVSTAVSHVAVSSSVSNTAVSNTVSSAAVCTTVKNSAASTAVRNSAASTAVRNSAASTAVRNSAASTAVSNAAISTSRCNAAVSTSKSNANVNTSRSNAVGMAFEREFPQLSSEDKNGRQGISRVPSPGVSTPIQNVPLINASDGWNSVLADIPLFNDTKKSPAVSSVLQTAPIKQTEAVSSNGTALSMAETVMQAPLRISIGPQLSIEAQKIEERTLRQYTLRPLTPTAGKSSVLSSSKTKTTRMGDPSGPSRTAQQLKIQSANGSARAPVKTDISNLSQSGSFQVLSREQTGTAHTSKELVSPPVPLVSTEPKKKPVVSQKFKTATHERPLPLQGPSGDRKSNARDKHRFFEMLRTKSSNGSSTTLESGCQPSPSGLVDAEQDSSLGNDFSLFHSGMKCLGHGKCLCEEANSSEGSQRHLSDNEENISSLKPDDVDGVFQQLLVQKREADTSSGDEEFQLSLSDSAEGSSSSALADSDDGCNRSQSGNEEQEDKEHPPPPEEKRFLIMLGWREDEVVRPLDLDEIADSVKSCAELEKKLWSMVSNANVKFILNILGRAKREATVAYRG